MTDLVKRLRAQSHDKGMFELCVDGATADEAADEIERLTEQLHYANGTCDLAMKHRDTAEAEIERLTAALTEIAEVADESADISINGYPTAAMSILTLARAALNIHKRGET